MKRTRALRSCAAFWLIRGDGGSVWVADLLTNASTLRRQPGTSGCSYGRTIYCSRHAGSTRRPAFRLWRNLHITASDTISSGRFGRGPSNSAVLNFYGTPGREARERGNEAKNHCGASVAPSRGYLNGRYGTVPATCSRPLLERFRKPSHPSL